MARWSVSQLNRYMKGLVSEDKQLSALQIVGELSNFKRHAASGHCYFSLKDEKATVSAVMFQSHAQKVHFKPENGMQVVARGYVSVYERSGIYQLYVDALLPVGIGNLQQQYEALREKLSREKVFKAPGEQRPLPQLPKKIGLVTSETGAVIRDMVTVMRRRHPSIHLLLAPALVQGSGGAASVCAALDALYAREDLDLIVVARGGGSQEDLWVFNEEAVVRKVAASPLPIISAIGHETDVTLTDFAADLRAGTPSIAAEQAVPDVSLLQQMVENRTRQLFDALQRRLREARLQYEVVTSERLLKAPARILDAYRLALDERLQLLDGRLESRLLDSGHQMEKRLQSLADLNPLAVFSRGFALCEKEDGALVRRHTDALPGESLRIYLAEGGLKAVVTAQLPETERMAYERS